MSGICVIGENGSVVPNRTKCGALYRALLDKKSKSLLFHEVGWDMVTNDWLMNIRKY